MKESIYALDGGVYLIRATGHSSAVRSPVGVGLGGLIPKPQSPALGGLPPDDDHFCAAVGALAPTADDFGDFRRHGPRMRIDDLDAPLGVFGVHAFPSVTRIGPLRHLAGPSRAYAASAGRQSAFVGSISPAPLSRSQTCTFPVAAGVMSPCALPVVDTAADALPVLLSTVGDVSDSAEGSQAPPRSSLGTAAVGGDPQIPLEGPSSPPPPSTSRARPTRLDPSDFNFHPHAPETCCRGSGSINPAGRCSFPKPVSGCAVGGEGRNRLDKTEKPSVLHTPSSSAAEETQGQQGLRTNAFRSIPNSSDPVPLPPVD